MAISEGVCGPVRLRKSQLNHIAALPAVPVHLPTPMESAGVAPNVAPALFPSRRLTLFARRVRATYAFAATYSLRRPKARQLLRVQRGNGRPTRLQRERDRCSAH